MKVKKCSKCGTEKPLTTEFFHRGKDTAEGFKSACKTCRSIEKKQWRDANKDKVNSVQRQYYQDNKEEIGKKNRDWYYRTHEERLKYIKEYYHKNKEKELKRAAKWAKENPEKVKEKYNRYVSKNHTHLLALKKGYRLRPETKVKIRLYKQSEQGRQANKRSKHKRRSLEREALATLTLNQWIECCNHFNNKCAYCGKSDKNGLTQEHFVPVMKGGEYTVTNIIPSCGSCNSSKSDRDFFEWYPQNKSYSAAREKKILKYLGVSNNTQQIALF